MKFLLEWMMFGFISWIVWNAAYHRGRWDLWNELAHGYIVLPKGSYWTKCKCKKNISRRKTKKGERKNVK